MRKIIFTIISILIIHCTLNTENCLSQWVKQQNFTENQVSRLLNYNGDILVGASNVFKSTDMGQSWTLFYQSNYWSINALSLVNGNIWVSNHYNNVYTTNNGINWINTSIVKYVYDFASNNSRIFAGTESWKCYYSDNGGLNWAQCQDIGEDVNCFLNLGNILLAGTSQGLYFTTNSGENWSVSSINGIPVLSIINNGSKLFAGTILGIWTSTDGGINWAQTSLGNFSVLSLEYSGQNIFAGTSQNGIFVSINNGLSWIQKNEGIGNIRINTLSFINNFLFAGTENSGLWKRQISEIIGIQNISSEIPSSFSLSQNYPNPFNPVTKIKFTISAESDRRACHLQVFDIIGREVETLVNEQLQPGTYEVNWDGTNYLSGIYFYKLTAGEFNETKKLVLIK